MDLLRQLRHAARRLLRAPSFSLSAALTLALGIGGTVAVFTVVNGILLRPLPYPQPERLVDLTHSIAVSGLTSIDQSDATYLLYRRDNRVFSDVGAYRASDVNMSAIAAAGGGTAQPERVAAALVSPSVFHVLGAGAVRGRAFLDDDAQPGAPPVAVIGYGLWSRAFASDPAIVGRRIDVNGVERQVVGVMPRSFDFPSARTGIWLPLQLDPARTKSAAFDYKAVARLRPGVTLAAATADLRRLLPQVPVVFPGRLKVSAISDAHMEPVVRPLRDAIVGNVSRALWIVMGAVAVLLLTACTNVANLFLARAEARRREVAVRRALGAPAGAIASEYLSEAGLVSATAWVLGIAGAYLGVGLLRSASSAATLPRLADVRVDGSVVAFASATVVLATLAVTLVPLLRSSGDALSAVLASGGRSAGGSPAHHRAQRVFVVTQVALALVLLSVAGLFARSFAQLRAVKPGFDAAHALSFRLAIPAEERPSMAATARTVVNLTTALGALPGVTSVGAATTLPLVAEGQQDSGVFQRGVALKRGQIPDIDPIVFATPGYFRAMGIPLLTGRLFPEPDPSLDPAKAPREVVVNQAFADRHWTPAAALGREIATNATGPFYTIVGVVGSVHESSLEQPPAPMVYLPLMTTTVADTAWTPRNLAFVVRTAGDPESITERVRDAVRMEDASLPVYRVLPLSALAADASSRTAFIMLLLGIAAMVATAIGAMGIYGVIAYLVSLRTREIGVYLALGAQRSDVWWLVVRRAIADALVGVAVGLVVTLLLTRAIAGSLFGVAPSDPAALGGAAAALIAVALLAAAIPALRAAALEPVLALRTE